MASPESIAASGTGNTGALSADTVFYIEEGPLDLSTNVSAGYIPFGSGEKVIISSGLTVYWRNNKPTAARLVYWSI